MNNTQTVFPKVSVIIPVWNSGPGICLCVDSLRGQTLEDIEMIFVDDCGTDGAMEVIRQASAEDLRIRSITNAENVGPGCQEMLVLKRRGANICLLSMRMITWMLFFWNVCMPRLSLVSWTL